MNGYSIAGVVNGTPIADQVGYMGSKLGGKLSLDNCTTKDDSGIGNLTLEKQFKWLSENPHIFDLGIKNYSLVTSSTADNTSLVFLPFHTYLYRAAGANDGQVNASNQLLPKSDLLGYFNSDHWAIILPFSDNLNSELEAENRIIRKIATKNKFPRVALLEAILVFVERDLQPKRYIK